MALVAVGTEAEAVEALAVGEAAEVVADEATEAEEVVVAAGQGLEEEAGTEAECLVMPVALVAEGWQTIALLPDLQMMP